MFDGINHLKAVEKMLEKKPCCDHGDHNVIDVIMSYRFVDNGETWKNRVCKKCLIPEALLDDHKNIEKYYNVGGIK
jgi:hypothetical protein